MTTDTADHPGRDRRSRAQRRSPDAASRRNFSAHIFCSASCVIYFLRPDLVAVRRQHRRMRTGPVRRRSARCGSPRTVDYLGQPAGPVHLQRRHLPAVARQLGCSTPSPAASAPRCSPCSPATASRSSAFRGRNFTFAILLGSVMVPLTALVIPTFMLLSQLHLTNTIWAVILPSLLSPFGVYLMRVYARDAVPDELLDAARVDGAGEFRTFLHGRAAADAAGDRDGAAAVGRRHLEQLLPAAGDAARTTGCSRSRSASATGRASPRRTTAAAHSLWSLIIIGSLVSIIPLDHRLPHAAEVLAGRTLPRQPQVASPQPSPSTPVPIPNTKDIVMHAHLTIDPHFAVGADQPPPLRLVRRAPRPLRLRRDLRARAPDRRRRGLPAGRHRAGQASSGSRPSATPAATSSPGSAGRTASARATSARAASTWPGTRPRRTRSACTSSRRGSRRSAASSCSPSTSAPAERSRRSTCSSTRTSRPAPRCRDQRIANGRTDAVRHQDVVPRQRDGRPVAARPPLRRRLRQARVADGEGDAPARPVGRARGVRLVERAHADLRRVGARRADPHLRRRRLHLVPRLLRGEERRPRQLPRLGGRHGPLHRVRRRDRRPRQGGQAAATRRSTSRSTSGTSGTSTATTTSTRSRASTTGRSPRACSRTPTRWPMPSSSATCSSRC